MKVHEKRAFENYSLFVTKNNIKADKFCMNFLQYKCAVDPLNPLLQKQPHLISQNLWLLAVN